MFKKLSVALTLTSLFLATLTAAVVPGRWDKVTTVDAGTDVIVLMLGGDRLEVAFEEYSDKELTVRTRDGDLLRLPTSDIMQVSREVEDRRTNGTLIGTGVGFGIGFGTTVALERSVTASGFRLEEENLSLAILGGAIGAGAGALLGWALDGATRTEEILYAVP